MTPYAVPDPSDLPDLSAIVPEEREHTAAVLLLYAMLQGERRVR